MHPGDPDRNASYETIYTALYAMPRGELHTEVIDLLRQDLPKGADRSVLSQRDLDASAFDLNVRPRKPLGWKCPLELFMPESFNYESCFHKLVALQTWNRHL